MLLADEYEAIDAQALEAPALLLESAAIESTAILPSANEMLALVRDTWAAVESRLFRMLPAAIGPMNVGKAAPPVRPPDAQIKRAVESRLGENAFLSRASIYVEAVYDGIVVLAGMASTPEDRVRAFEETVDVPGVRRVISEVAVQDVAWSVAAA